MPNLETEGLSRWFQQLAKKNSPEDKRRSAYAALGGPQDSNLDVELANVAFAELEYKARSLVVSWYELHHVPVAVAAVAAGFGLSPVMLRIADLKTKLIFGYYPNYDDRKVMGWWDRVFVNEIDTIGADLVKYRDTPDQFRVLDVSRMVLMPPKINDTANGKTTTDFENGWHTTTFVIDEYYIANAVGVVRLTRDGLFEQVEGSKVRTMYTIPIDVII